MSKSDIAIQSNLWENNSVLREKRQKTQKQNYMPFLFRSKRQFVKDKSNSPPVGSYQIPSSFNLTKSQSQPEFIKQKLQLKNQMSIFKSNQQRFVINKSHNPGPASYNCLNSDSRTKFVKINNVPASRKLQQKMDLIKRSPSCPAIPDSKVKFGYVKDSQGNYKLIQKSQTQVEKQKLKMKQYLSTLDGENQFMKRLQIRQQPYLSKKNKQQQAILNNLEKFVQKRSISESRIMSADKNKDFTKLIKPKIKLSYGVNVVKQKQDHLGPGCYNVNLDTLKKAKKDQSFQFFSSSQIRFTPIVKQTPPNPYEYIFKEKKNLNLKQKVQGKIYKKSFPTNPIDPTCLQKEQLPGPGYYEPQVQKVKKSKGNVLFGYESRFKQNIHDFQQQHEQEHHQNLVQSNENPMKWGNLKKDKLKSPHKQFVPVNQSQIVGIMNQELSQKNTSNQNLKFNVNKKKQSAAFLDKSSRTNICNKTYYQGESQINVGESSSKLWQTKGSFMSKVPKKYLEIKQDTPGPGAYQKLTVENKKSFNIKNQ